MNGVATTMIPSEELLPDVLPTERLMAGGKAVPEIRAELRRIPNARNAVAVVGVYLQSFGVMALAVWIGQWWAYLLCFLLMGRAIAAFASLSHEAAHRLLFSRKQVNDWVGRWVVGYPAFISTDLYRRGHLAHHRDEFGPDEPDMNLYRGYPVSRASLRRKLTRDLFGQSGWKNLKSLFRGLKYDGTRVHAVRILVVQAVIFGVFAALGQWWLYWVMWFLPWMTLWRVTNRLRAIAEHGGMERSKDRRRTTHSVRQHLAARFLMVPYNIGWHLAHHVDMGVPWKHLPAYHRELVASGWVPEGLEYRNYPALWRKLGSGADVAAMAEIEAELGSEFEPATAARRAPATAADTQLAGSAGPSS